jgi:hypothetical protein
LNLRPLGVALVQQENSRASESGSRTREESHTAAGQQQDEQQKQKNAPPELGKN